MKGSPSTRRAIAVALLAAGLPSIALATPERAIEPCERNLPSAVNLPVLLKIDRPAGLVTSRLDVGGERLSEIGGEWGDGATHVLHGIDEGNPWSLRVNLTTGRFTLTSAQEHTGYVAFGSCSSRLLE